VSHLHTRPSRHIVRPTCRTCCRTGRLSTPSTWTTPTRTISTPESDSPGSRAAARGAAAAHAGTSPPRPCGAGSRAGRSTAASSLAEGLVTPRRSQSRPHTRRLWESVSPSDKLKPNRQNFHYQMLCPLTKVPHIFNWPMGWLKCMSHHQTAYGVTWSVITPIVQQHHKSTRSRSPCTY